MASNSNIRSKSPQFMWNSGSSIVIRDSLGMQRSNNIAASNGRRGSTSQPGGRLPPLQYPIKALSGVRQRESVCWVLKAASGLFLDGDEDYKVDLESRWYPTLISATHVSSCLLFRVRQWVVALSTYPFNILISCRNGDINRHGKAWSLYVNSSFTFFHHIILSIILLVVTR